MVASGKKREVLGMGKRTNTAVWMDKYNRWQIKVQKDGLRKTFYSSLEGRKGQRECNEKADAWLDDNIVNSSVKVSILFEKWIDELKVTTSKSFWRQYEGYGRNYIKPQIGAMKIGNINEQHLQEVILYAYSNGNEKNGLSDKTLRNIRACLMAFIKYTRKNKATTLFPESLYIPKAAKKSVKNILQPNDFKLLFSRTKTIYHKKEITEWYIYAYRFEVVTGLRPGELIGLKHEDIKGNICTLHGAINVYNEHTTGKNENALRSFVLSDIAIKILADQRTMLKGVKLLSPYIFPDPYGEHTKQITYYKRWRNYRDHNGISPVTLYELRHTFISANKEIPLELIKPIVGHGKDFDTFGTYGHILGDEQYRAAALINDVLAKLING